MGAHLFLFLQLRVQRGASTIGKCPMFGKEIDDGPKQLKFLQNPQKNKVVSGTHELIINRNHTTQPPPRPPQI